MTKLGDQFQKKSWANKLELRRRLYSLKLDEGGLVQAHIKTMMEGLSVVGDPISDEDRVVHLLASLPDSYGMLVTALEAHEQVPEMDLVIERLLSEERKMKERVASGIGAGRKDNALIANRGKICKCFHCGKPGHFKRSCPLFGSSNQDGKKPGRTEEKYKKEEARIEEH